MYTYIGHQTPLLSLTHTHTHTHTLTLSPPSLSLRYAADIAYLNLANVLHRNEKSSDAIVPLMLAVEISPDVNVLHYTLGNVYVVS